LAEIIAEPSLELRRAALEDVFVRASWIEARVLLSPLRGLFERVAERLDKAADLELIGQSVLVDPQHVGTVFSSLGHLIRNSLDHGLERAAMRGNKPARGRVVVSCRDLQDAWIIEVSDDGRGIDADALCHAAVAQGRLAPERLLGMSREERLRLIFLDGLTTKEEATIDSGRGVGMTALLEGVSAQGGRIELWSEPGLGTRTCIYLPKPGTRVSSARASMRAS
jgi:chemotaxis protein histidine kinase CheA